MVLESDKICEIKMKLIKVKNVGAVLSLICWVFILSVKTSFPTNAALPMAVDGQPLPTLAPMLEGVVDAVVNIST